MGEKRGEGRRTRTRRTHARTHERFTSHKNIVGRALVPQKEKKASERK